MSCALAIVRVVIVTALLAGSLQPANADINTEFAQEIADYQENPTGASLERLLESVTDRYPSSALSFYEDGNEFIQSLPPAERLRLNAIACRLYQSEGNGVSAKRVCESQIRLAERLSNERYAADGYLALALVYVAESNDVEAIRCFDMAIASTTDPTIRAIAYFHSATLLKERLAYELAFERFSSALQEIEESSSDTTASSHHAAMIYVHMGEMNHRLGALVTAESQYKNAIERAQTADSVFHQVDALRLLTELYLEGGELVLADEQSRLATQFAENRDLLTQSTAAVARVDVLLEQRKLDEALSFAESAYSNADEYLSSLNSIAPTIAMIKTLSAHGDYAEAIRVVDTLIGQLRRAGKISLLEQALELKPELLAASGDVVGAYATSQELNRLSKENLKNNTQQRMNILHALLDVDRQAARAEEARFSQETAEARATSAALLRNVSIASGLVLLLVTYLLLSRRYQNKQAKVAQQAKLEMEKELSERTATLVTEAENRVELETRLLHAEKMESIGNLTGGVAHDFNNLMTVVMGATELALQSSKSQYSELDRMSLQNAYEAAASGAGITRQLLAFASKQPLQPSLTELGQHIKDTLNVFDRLLGDSVSMSASIGDTPFWCEIDRAQLTTALLNLVLNARDAVPSGGTILFECQLEAIDASHAQLSPGDYCRISVIDNGRGMDKATLECAVEPFFTTKELGQGNGLGLSMVYGFTKQSNGGFSINSKESEGTSATIWLPICAVPDSVEQTSSKIGRPWGQSNALTPVV